MIHHFRLAASPPRCLTAFFSTSRPLDSSTSRLYVSSPHRLAAFALAFLLLTGAMPAEAQTVETPSNCTESMTVGAIFIGHDCGEWASVVISGRVVMRKPWTRVNRASRAARIRARREAGAVATVTPAAETGTLYGIDISGGTDPDDLDCEDFEFREDAEDLWEEQGWSADNDPHNLDAEGDGEPCESLRTRRG